MQAGEMIAVLMSASEAALRTKIEHMKEFALHERISALREEYRCKMNAAADKAQVAAAEDRMVDVSEHSSESERMREAFVALNRVMQIVEEFDAV